MTTVTAEGLLNAFATPSLANDFYHHLGMYTVAEESHQVKWLRDNAMAFLQHRGFLTFLHTGTLPKKLREEIAKAFVFSFVRCYVDVAGIESNEGAAPVFSSIQEVQDEFIRLCNVYMGSVYRNANWNKAQTIAGITACLDELLSICSEGFRPVAKRALVPEEQVFRMADWYEQDSP